MWGVRTALGSEPAETIKSEAFLLLSFLTGTMIARVEKSFYGAQALSELVSDTEPDSSSDHISGHSSSVTQGSSHPPRGLSRALARASTDADRSDTTDSEPVRLQTKKRRRDSSTDSKKSVMAGSKRRKASEAYRNRLYRRAIEIEQESADDSCSDERSTREGAEAKKKRQKQAIKEQEDRKKDP